MKSAWRNVWASGLAVLVVAVAQPGGYNDARAADEVTLKTTTGGVEYGLWGDKAIQSGKPAPTLFILAGTIDGTLTKPVYRQAGTILAERGYLCVSLDLPCHGTQEKPGQKGLSGWRARAVAGDDFVAEFVGRASAVLDDLIAQGLTDEKRVAVCGTSRGGFLSLQWAAHEPRVDAVAGYSPVTDLRGLSEFKATESNTSVDAMNIFKQVDALAGRPIFIIIGDRDGRVQTDAAIKLSRMLSAKAVDAKVPSQLDLLVVSEPRGDHTAPARADQLSADFIYRKLEGRELTP